jgi:DNA-binding CsgD family transcriptional regulator
VEGAPPSNPDTLTPDEVRRIVGVLSEVAAHPGDGRERKCLLMDRVGGLLGADRWIWLVSRYDAPGENMMGVSFLHRGYSEREIALFMESAADPAAPIPEHPRLAALCRDGKHFTRRRHELVDDDEWYACEHYRRYRKPLGLNEFLYSIRPLDGDMLSGVGFHRLAGRPAFSDRDSLMAHVLFAAAEALHTMDLPDCGDADILKLPPRVRTTFGLLIEGLPRKRIAEHLGVSPNTIAEYSSRVYKHFGVGGQRELMLRFRNADGQHRAPSRDGRVRRSDADADGRGSPSEGGLRGG